MTTAVEWPVRQRFSDVKQLIGNTPLLEIRFRFRRTERRLFAKAEHLNLTGSIKDRMAFHILKRAYQSGAIEPGDTIVEATSGNSGISFAAVARSLGHKVVIFMPEWMSNERKALIRSFGATVIPVSHEQGGFVGSIRLTEEYAAKHPRVFLPQQFCNAANIEAHEMTTGPELWWQLKSLGLTPDAFVAGVGTGGTVMGVGRFLRSRKAAVRLHPVEPLESPTISTGSKAGNHRIQGISDEFVPSILDLGQLDRVIGVSDGDAILMAQKLASDLGLAVGISSGANFIAALMAQEALGGRAVTATVFADDNKKYLTTDLMNEEPARPSYLSTEVELIGYRALGRVCGTCLDPADDGWDRPRIAMMG
jgi:cysteine synthase